MTIEPQFFLLLAEDTEGETPTVVSLEATAENVSIFCEQAVSVDSAVYACVTLFKNIKINSLCLLHLCRI